jgi:phosphopantothenoylcysteine decarboxylase / phosphopantothenate---cysteine ligase
MDRKSIVLGVSGCIAAYKAAEILRRLQDCQAGVRVVMTRHAQHFVGPLTFEALSRSAVITDMFATHPGAEIEHISLAQSADCLLVAPATANVLGKFARGIADDFLTTLYLSFTRPVVIAPGMNMEMWNHPAVRENVDLLRNRGVRFVDPEEGYLACGTVGAGRLADPARIVSFVMGLLESGAQFAGKRFLVTAGPTVEDIDPVRFISNRSSGKMGYALAAEAANRGAEVVLVSGPVALGCPAGVRRIEVRGASEMHKAVLGYFDKADVVVMAAAVSDYAPQNVARQKIKKAAGRGLRLELAATPDILGDLGKRRRNQLLVGFAAETERVVDHARMKLSRKGVDLLVANDVSLPDSGFDSDYNTVTLLQPGEAATELPRLPKPEVAAKVMDRISALLTGKSS